MNIFSMLKCMHKVTKHSPDSSREKEKEKEKGGQTLEVSHVE